MLHLVQMHNSAGRRLYSASSDGCVVNPCRTRVATRRKSRATLPFVCQAASNSDPILLRAARGEDVERPPCWMMRQAGRYQAAYRELAQKYPSFRERSETADLIVKITLQPWKTFQPDGLILFSDILTPLPAIGVPFEIDDNQGPVVLNTIRNFDQAKQLHEIDLDQVQFVGQALQALRQEVGNELPLGKAIAYDSTIMEACEKWVLEDQLAAFLIYQIESGAQFMQIFDSWGGSLPPDVWDKWSRPYIERIAKAAKAKFPDAPITLYVNNSGGLVERMLDTSTDVLGLDWSVDMGDCRRRVGPEVTIQGNIDPVILFASQAAVEAAVRDCVAKAGNRRHILNLGHGIQVGTPEENVKFMFDLSKTLLYDS